MRLFVIANPAAGQGTAQSKIPLLRKCLEDHGISHDLVLTERPWHAAELAEKAASEGYDTIASAGGDGTANETINGIMRSGKSADDRPAFFVFGIGRGNDFAFGAGIPADIDEGCRTVAGEAMGTIDVGFLAGGDYPDGRYFGNGIGIGFDTIVGLEAAKMKRLHGFSAYAVGALKTLIIYPEAPEVKMSGPDGVSVVHTHQISLMNGRRMGGGFYMAPEALMTDGLLDLCMARKVNRRQMISLIVMYLGGKQSESDLITTGRGRHYRFEAVEGSLVVHADGETICSGGSTLDVECLPAQIRIHASPSAV